ncbi:MAG: bifunctional glutamate N-acetyltransferase/amino-acid acetyltransferase ArgJ [Victivallales bacterium]|nr:bifunctional glutamate N-acetyltransferase/amino-acid acetyltransferase ArgJ [Victivallales bacterium]
MLINTEFKSPENFKLSGVTAGLKKSRLPDMALLYSTKPAKAAAVFTSNKFAAAPVLYCRNILSEDNAAIQAVIINSGNANACTGENGYANVVKTAEKTARLLNIRNDSVLVSSTGVIGEQLPFDKICKGVEKAVKELSETGGYAAAQAIMTTDTVPKTASVKVNIKGTDITISAIAKGAGMIAPDMKPHATLLVFAMTDADIDKDLLKTIFYDTINKSFNKITIDGDMSTNDTALILANGSCGNPTIRYSDTEECSIFSEALTDLMVFLAKETVKDGEGVTKFVTLNITNASSVSEAEKCAKAIANSLLCKTAWFGCDGNWGRIVMAIGMSGINFNPEKVDIYYDNIPVALDGTNAETDKYKIDEVLKKPEFSLNIDLKEGNSDYSLWTNDISYKYVAINAEYHT